MGPDHLRVARRALFGAAVLAVGAGTVALGASPVTAADTGVFYVVQGLPDKTVDIAVDGSTIASSVPGATLKGPFTLSAGTHKVTFTSGGSTLLERTMPVKAGDNTDVVLHLPVDPTGAPVVTLYDNKVTPVPAGKASVTVAHTAAVAPADIRVDGKVLFANIANGEALNLVVPAGTYSVDIVPAGQTSPVVLGPLDLKVASASLNRVFAVGDPASDDMRVVVQVLAAAGSASGVPGRVDTGTGGQAVGATVSPLLRTPLAGALPTR